MNAERPEVTAPRVSFAAAVVASVVFLVAAALVVSSLVRLVVAPVLSHGRLLDGWTPASAFVLVALSLVALCLFGASLYRRLNTQLGSDGITFPSLQGRTHVPWSEVERVSGRGMQIKLHTARVVVTVNALCYTNPGGVAAFLQAKLPLRALGAQNAT